MFSCQSRRRGEDRCWIMLGKWFMASFTCLVFNERGGGGMKDEGDYRKRDRCWRRLKGGLHSA